MMINDMDDAKFIYKAKKERKKIEQLPQWNRRRLKTRGSKLI